MMKILSTSTIQDIYDQFSAQFPYLKIEFYNKAHVHGQGSRNDDLIPHQTLLHKVNPDIQATDFLIHDDMTVADFETWMEKELKLHVQVFRKSNDIWLQTSATDSWSLGKQNGKGQRSTIDYEIAPIDITDFDVE
jgi:hypothetical protein